MFRWLNYFYENPVELNENKLSSFSFVIKYIKTSSGFSFPRHPRKGVSSSHYLDSSVGFNVAVDTFRRLRQPNHPEDCHDDLG